jgi:hypothetical protein
MSGLAAIASAVILRRLLNGTTGFVTVYGASGEAIRDSDRTSLRGFQDPPISLPITDGGRGRR